MIQEETPPATNLPTLVSGRSTIPPASRTLQETQPLSHLL